MMGSVEEKMDLVFDEEEAPFAFNVDVLSPIDVDLPKSSFFNKAHLRTIYLVLIKAKINMLLPFGPLAIFLHYVTGSYFFLSFPSSESDLSTLCLIYLSLRDGCSSSAYWVLLLWQNVSVMLLNSLPSTLDQQARIAQK